MSHHIVMTGTAERANSLLSDFAAVQKKHQRRENKCHKQGPEHNTGMFHLSHGGRGHWSCMQWRQFPHTFFPQVRALWTTCLCHTKVKTVPTRAIWLCYKIKPFKDNSTPKRSWKGSPVVAHCALSVRNSTDMFGLSLPSGMNTGRYEESPHRKLTILTPHSWASSL